MSFKTKKRLFIALAGLLASSTAAVLVAYPGISDSRPHPSSAQVNGETGCPASKEGVCEFSLSAQDEAPFVFDLDFGVDTPFTAYPSLSYGIAATHGESARWPSAEELGASEDRFSFEDRQLISDITHQLGSGYNIGPQGQFQMDSSGAMSSLRHFNSLRSVAGSARIPDSVVPGTDTPGPSSGAPGGSAPGGNAPGDSAPGGNAPGGSAPGSNAPADNSPGGSSPGGNAPGGGAPGSGDPVTVPEPGTMGLLAFGLAAAAVMRRRRLV